MSARRAIAVGVGIAAGAGVAFCAGLVVGWFSAWGDVLGLKAPASAAYSVAALKELRRGNSDQALSMLELSLDGYFIDRWAFDQSKHPIASRVWPGDTERVLMARAARYRLEHPSEHPDADVRLAICEVATRYAKPESR
jgi:hypothetical protein